MACVVPTSPSRWAPTAIRDKQMGSGFSRKPSMFNPPWTNPRPEWIRCLRGGVVHRPPT
ncbi:hypothetical protein HPP92_024628 [Vanilla planifolia]|uniref:Uncharacterized protein n=1 Tax=Vanilla planifolia TaxID=51239 RepID=A0A835PFG7_VANPL|nr:hypothetical protein HPP92_026579 [Vanilla planifolia]KAG0456840.1 hypothetical protein HPP92_024628 [Vanilla planifolia]